MKLPVLKAPIVVNIVVIIFSACISFFTLLFGIAHIIEAIIGGGNPDIPSSESLKGYAVVISLCIIGVVFLVITIAAFRGILDRIKRRKEV